MDFRALRDRLPSLEPAEPTSPWPRVGRGGVSFSDDLLCPEGRIGVRVRITDDGNGGYCIDLRDSDPPDQAHRFGLSEARATTACVLALGSALGEQPGAGWSKRLSLLTDPRTFIGTNDEGCDPAAIAFAMARTIDAVLGALANAWPGRVGAGSCTVGAVVELLDGDDVVLTEALPGGEGGQPNHPGSAAWAGPVIASPWPHPPAVDGIIIEGGIREGSGGVGKHAGGDGVERTYVAERPLQARVAFDRVSNPPHGIDRAGPPLGSEVVVQGRGDDRASAVVPWAPLSLGAGDRLIVRTCGGAGWGFPGYGDIEWDPSEWFGSKPKQ
ncbi:MAG: hydantoinase B/oxoprolinase family protein [Deltaproteobacteria bacterium]|nr:hydantoinase B/oxoprolinase family protein [Deltaproteobacteria bacterium]